MGEGTFIKRKDEVADKGTGIDENELIFEQVKRKYFTQAEYWETIRRNHLYDQATETREIRDYVYRCSGATYFGEFEGGFR